MKSFKNYLIESTPVHKSITQSMFNKFAQGEYKNNIKHTFDQGEILYRGTRDEKLIHNAISLYGFNDTERKSANTNNIYNTLVSSDMLESWQAYPKRNKSFICTNNATYASGYGTVMCVIPPDNTKIGLCPDFDFWYSFKSVKNLGFDEMDDFNSILALFVDIVLNDNSVNDLGSKNAEYIKNELLKCAAMISELGKEGFLERVQKELSAIDDVWGHNALLLKLTQSIIKHGSKLDFIDFLNDILSPQANDFRVIDYTQIDSGERRELWFSGNALFISDYDEFKSMYQASTK